MNVPSLYGVAAGFCAETETSAIPAVRQTMVNVRMGLQSVSAKRREFSGNSLPVFLLTAVISRGSRARTVEAQDVAAHLVGDAGKAALSQFVQPLGVSVVGEPIFSVPCRLTRIEVGVRKLKPAVAHACQRSLETISAAATLLSKSVCASGVRALNDSGFNGPIFGSTR